MILVKKSSKQEESYTQGTLLLIFFVMDLPLNGWALPVMVVSLRGPCCMDLPPDCNRFGLRSRTYIELLRYSTWLNIVQHVPIILSPTATVLYSSKGMVGRGGWSTRRVRRKFPRQYRFQRRTRYPI